MADFTDRASLGTSRINPSSMIPGARNNAPQIGAASQFRGASYPQGSGAASAPVVGHSTGTAPNIHAGAPQIGHSTGTAPNNRIGAMQMQALIEQLNSSGTPKPGQRVSSRGQNRVIIPESFTGTAQENPNLVMDFHKTSQSDLPTETQQMLPSGDNKKKTRSFKQDDFKMLSDVFKTLSEQ